MPTLAEQLGISPGMRGQVSGEPQGLDIESLKEQEGGRDFVVVFLRARQEVEQLAKKLVAAIDEGGLLWICFPQPAPDDEEVTNLAVKTDLTIEGSWQALADLGYGPVQQESLQGDGDDCTWVALCFQPLSSRH